jgi:hypothetical protein
LSAPLDHPFTATEHASIEKPWRFRTRKANRAAPAEPRRADAGFSCGVNLPIIRWWWAVPHPEIWG